MSAPDWATLLDCTKTGPRPNLTNAVRVLQHDPTLGPSRIWRDEFFDRIMVRNSAAREWRDDDDTQLAVYMQEHAGIGTMQERTVASAVRLVARQRTRHVVRDWMRSLTWDHVPRIRRAFCEHWGAEDTPYVRAASRNFFIGLAARILQPGCKLDTMPVFEGPQGIRKSTALAALGGPWYSIAHEAVGSKDFLQGLRGVWLLEIAELQSFSKADVMSVKNMLSSPCDDYRPSYGRHVLRYPRQCVMAGTTNADQWGADDSGLRRFWPIQCGTIDVEALLRARDQLIAEAVEAVDAGGAWWEMPLDTSEVQSARQYHDEWTGPVFEWMALQAPGVGVLLLDILTGPLRTPVERCEKSLQLRVASILRLGGWERKRTRVGPKPRWLWFKKDEQPGTRRHTGNIENDDFSV